MDTRNLIDILREKFYRNQVETILGFPNWKSRYFAEFPRQLLNFSKWHWMVPVRHIVFETFEKWLNPNLEKKSNYFHSKGFSLAIGQMKTIYYWFNYSTRRPTSAGIFNLLVSKKFGKEGGGREYHDLRLKISSHSTETFHTGTRLCLRKFLVSKNVKDERWRVSRFSVIFCLTVAKNFVGEPFCFRKFLVSKNVRDRRGISRFSVEIALSYSTETFRRPTLVSEKVRNRRNLWLRKGVYHDFHIVTIVEWDVVGNQQLLSEKNKSELRFRKALV